MKNAIITFLTIFVVMLVGITGCQDEVEAAVKSGEKSLYCNFSDGYRKVPSEKIIGIAEDGSWQFVNGFARNCEVK